MCGFFFLIFLARIFYCCADRFSDMAEAAEQSFSKIFLGGQAVEGVKTKVFLGFFWFFFVVFFSLFSLFGLSHDSRPGCRSGQDLSSR